MGTFGTFRAFPTSEKNAPTVRKGFQHFLANLLLNTMTKIAVIYYSMYGHVHTLAKAAIEGAKKVEGVTVDVFQIPETLPEEVLQKMHAPPKAEDVPVADPKTLLEYDGFLLGVPTRFGNFPAQWKTFFDATGQIWQSGGYHGKFAGVFTSTASQHGGQESTILATISTLAHHGIVYVPLGYAHSFAELTQLNEIAGGSPYGAGTIAGGDGSRQPSEIEKKVASIQGEQFAILVKKATHTH
ncbi:hypothetical protein PROFUN_10778 [Planoprotostelium fungivorum]|uniref:Flavodoxin-like domain-containing protein n=1 Tax=Planoprotostelium fungivorum TaxID=1890364 RepID=A0A2P6NCU8_9EUKA|nr:hypothetical protein PROFUN_10778 [Planoprotostelium fungivorum]